MELCVLVSTGNEKWRSHYEKQYGFSTKKFFIVFLLVFGSHIAQTLVDMKIDIQSHAYDAIVLNERNGGTWIYFWFGKL